MIAEPTFIIRPSPKFKDPILLGPVYRPRRERVKPDKTKTQKKRRAAAKAARKARKKNR